MSNTKYIVAQMKEVVVAIVEDKRSAWQLKDLFPNSRIIEVPDSELIMTREEYEQRVAL